MPTADGPKSPGESAAAALEGLRRLKDEHRPLLAQIAGDPGMSPEVRQSLIAHLYAEEDERLAEVANAPAPAPARAERMAMATANPLSPTQWSFLQSEVVREAKRTLVGRRFLGLYGPLGAGIESIGIEQYGPDHDAEIELVGRHDPEPIVVARESFVRVPILYKDFILHWRDVELSQKLGAPLDASRALRAAHFVADREDTLLFLGDERLKQEGLLNATGRNTVKRGDWAKYGTAYQDVVRAIDTLLQHNHHRPFAAVVSAHDYARLVQQREGQYAAEVDAILKLCDDGVYNSPAIPTGKAVILSTGDQNFDIAVTEDLTIAFLGERDQDFPFRVYECLVLRIKRPHAICTIE